jgi:hypothetical protein
VQLETSNTSYAAKIRDCSLIIVLLTNYYYSSDDNYRDFASTIYQDGLTLSIPTPTAGDYLVLAATSISTDSTSKPGMYVNWDRNGNSQAEIVR